MCSQSLRFVDEAAFEVTQSEARTVLDQALLTYYNLGDDATPEEGAAATAGLDSESTVQVNRAQMVLELIPFVVPFRMRVILFEERTEDARQRYAFCSFPLRSSGVSLCCLTRCCLSPVSSSGLCLLLFLCALFILCTHALSRQGAHYRIPVNVERGNEFPDAFDQLAGMRGRLRLRLNVQYSSALGYQEAGIDGGGLQKEFLNECAPVFLFSFFHSCSLFFVY